ncbi:MAG: type II toxin-antitoxin system prevent-host-death family antitoxin [Verrucomicrobiota bacterium]
MSTITLSDLKKKSANQWRKSPKKNELIVTSQGQPIAVLLSIDEESLEPTLSTLRSVRALQAQATLQKDVAVSGAEKLTMAEIDAEIAAVRRARRHK